jgi:hypothetical protein
MRGTELRTSLNIRMKKASAVPFFAERGAAILAF